MANKIYQLTYDDKVDRDIENWLEKLPRNRKAEMVRHAIRFYISYAGESNAIQMPGIAAPLAPPVQMVKEQPVVVEEPVKKKKPSLPKDGLF